MEVLEQVPRQAPPNEPKSITELTHELINLDPPASIDQLIQALDMLWCAPSPLADRLIDAISKRPELEARHLTRIIKRRDIGGPIQMVCDLLLERKPSIYDLRFALNYAHVPRNPIACAIANHPEASYSDLTAAHACSDLDTECRERLEQRIDAIRQSPASLLLRRMEIRYPQSNYRVD